MQKLFLKDSELYSHADAATSQQTNWALLHYLSRLKYVNNVHFLFTYIRTFYLFNLIISRSASASSCLNITGAISNKVCMYMYVGKEAAITVKSKLH